MRTLLVANRGEIARRIIRTARAMGVRTVAVYSDPDARSLHAAEADVAVALQGSSPAESYLDVDKLIRAAERTGADAVHPGYGFLSERAPAAQAFIDAGLTWVGPPPDVIAVLGDKIRAKELMAAAGVAVLAGATISDGEDPVAAAQTIGYPLLVKAAAGGGGRGMRLVSAPGELAAGVAAAAREAASAFGDGTIFLERWLATPRHVEVQVIADASGQVIHLGERECSIQRRHQKVLEETPAPGIGGELRGRLTAAAVAGARAVGYVGAGTWEFLVAGDDFFFLEVNTRLQVEHPVTEAVTGLDLVRLQLEVAGGGRLDLRQDDVDFGGHAIEVRVVAEDPALGWRPSIGTLHLFERGPNSDTVGLRFDLGCTSGAVITADYDSLLGKVIAHAPTRSEAARRLGAALSGLEIHGLTTNRDLLVGIVGDADFLAGHTTTGFLDAHPALAKVVEDETSVALHALAASLWGQGMRRRTSPVLTTLPSGWRNLRSQPERAAWSAGTTVMEVSYTLSLGDRSAALPIDGPIDGPTAALDSGRRWTGPAGESFVASAGSHEFTGRIFEVDDDGIDLEVNGLRYRCRCHQAAGSVWVGSGAGQTTLIETPRFVEPGTSATTGPGLTAPMPGTVIAIEVRPGQSVNEGQTLVVLEAMKLEHRIRAHRDGTVAEIPIGVGEKVDEHQVLVHLVAEREP